MNRHLVCFLAILLGAIGSLRADDTISALQTRLKTGGFYFGEINGNYDSETAAAVTRYQIRNGLQITGKLDEPTRFALGLSSTAPKAPPPRFGEDVWRYLRKSDQARINRMMAEDARKDQKPESPPASTAKPPVPPKNPAPAPVTENDQLKDYIGAFVLAGLDPQVGAETEFFADRVNYFGEPHVSREKIRRDLQRYNQRWPERSFRLAGELEVKQAGDKLSVTFPLRYELRNASKHSAGTVRKTLVLEKTANDFQIVAVNERKGR